MCLLKVIYEFYFTTFITPDFQKPLNTLKQDFLFRFCDLQCLLK